MSRKRSLKYSSKMNVKRIERVHSLPNKAVPEHYLTKEMNGAQQNRFVIHTNINSRNSRRNTLNGNDLIPINSKKLTTTEHETYTIQKPKPIILKRVIVTPVRTYQPQKQIASRSLIRAASSADQKLSLESSLNDDDIQQNIINENSISNDPNNITFGASYTSFNTELTSGWISDQNFKSIGSRKKMNYGKKAPPKSMKLKSSRRSPKIKPISKKKKDNRWRRRCGFCGPCHCSPLCVALSILGILLLLAAIIGLILGLILTNKKTTTTTTTTTTSTTSTSTTTKTTTTTTTTKTTTTTSTTTTSTTTITTTTTTTTAVYCGQSCLNQSWVDTTGGIGLWPFDGSFVDAYNVYNGTPSSNPPTFTTGYLNQAASFSATAQQTIYTRHIPFSNVSFTVQAWIKPTGYPNPSDHGIVGLCPSVTSNYCLHIIIRNTKLYFGFFFNDVPGTTVIALNKWAHVAFVFDVGTKVQTIYLDGYQDGQGTVTSALLATSGNFTIGYWGVSASNSNFQGLMDNLSINRRAMSSCEILERATLAAQFKFNAASPYSDSGPNSVPANSSTTTIVAGYKNEAILFAGSSTSYFQTWGFTSFGINNQPFSITFWIQPQTLSGTLVHLSTSSTGTGSQCFPLLGFAANGAIVGQVLTGIGTVATATGPILPTSASWIPVVETWSSTNGLRLYVNNTLVSSVTASSFLTSGTTPNYLTLGNCLNGCVGCTNGLVNPTGPFTGLIDDWRIYSRELTSSDVCTLFYA